MWALKVMRSTKAATSRGSGRRFPIAERQVAGQPDTGSFFALGDDLEQFFALGDDLEQQFGSANVDLNVAQFLEQ
jgi:hypothetical protein